MKINVVLRKRNRGIYTLRGKNARYRTVLKKQGKELDRLYNEIWGYKQSR